MRRFVCCTFAIVLGLYAHGAQARVWEPTPGHVQVPI